MNLPLFAPTYAVSQLCAEIKEVLGEVFPPLWVAGEAQRVRESARGHLYFELVEKDHADGIRAKLDAVVWRTDWQRVERTLGLAGQRVSDGLQLRCRGNLDFYGPSGRLQLIVREVDPAFTLGLLEQRRRETLAALAAAGLLDANAGRPLPELPLTVALVTSEGSAAYHDFLSTLRESGYGFRVLLVHAAVQGRSAERELVAAIELACRAGGCDCICLLRGGGAKSDLAVFDSRAVAEAVATSTLPVLTGLGHEIDESITDRVAHLALKTPTKVAELLVERVGRAETAMEELRHAVAAAGRERLARGREAVGRAERGVEMARLRLAAAATRLADRARALGRAGRARLREAEAGCRQAGRRLAAAAPRLLARRATDPEAAARRLAALAAGRLRETTARLDGFERLARELAPRRTLARGYTITRAAAGRPVTDPAQVAAGERIITETAGGTLASRVEEG